jgi:hypothetical protein
MKSPATYLRTLTVAALLCATPLSAQDGWLFSAQPPIVVRAAIAESKVYFTNTSDKPLHGITMKSKDKEDTKSSRVIIDTIEPHKTVAIDLLVELLSDDTTITCTNYSKPLPIKLL